QRLRYGLRGLLRRNEIYWCRLHTSLVYGRLRSRCLGVLRGRCSRGVLSRDLLHMLKENINFRQQISTMNPAACDFEAHNINVRIRLFRSQNSVEICIPGYSLNLLQEFRTCLQRSALAQTQRNVVGNDCFVIRRKRPRLHWSVSYYPLVAIVEIDERIRRDDRLAGTVQYAPFGLYLRRLPQCALRCSGAKRWRRGDGRSWRSRYLRHSGRIRHIRERRYRYGWEWHYDCPLSACDAMPIFLR